MSNSISALANSTAAQDVSEAATSAAKKGQVSTDQFLQLLVAQVKNQDPLNPTDGVQFLTQLAQFSQLEQMIGVRTDLQGIAEQLEPPTTGTKTGDKDVV
ncbi:MAG: hypothetical protein H7039_24490 [Bryobacteraceae bacterium]|nr:hypothetical protein [Bryobacteraceae bacterium]